MSDALEDYEGTVRLALVINKYITKYVEKRKSVLIETFHV